MTTACLDALDASPPALARRVDALMLASVEHPADDDAQLMCRYADGDVAAFEQLYARHRVALWRFVLRHLRDAAATDDVFQETWARVVANADRYRPTAPFGAWLYRIAHNCCADQWRRSGRAARRQHEDGESLLASLPDCAAAGPAEQAMQEQAQEALRAAVEQLPDAQRAAFLMYAEGGLSLEEIAAATGVGPETAKSRLRYAVARLRRTLADAQRKEQT